MAFVGILKVFLALLGSWEFVGNRVLGEGLNRQTEPPAA